jgi:subtilase family serine protease
MRNSVRVAAGLAFAIAVLGTGRVSGQTIILQEDFEGTFPNPNWTLWGDPATQDWGLTTYRTPTGSGHSVYCCQTGTPPPGPVPKRIMAFMEFGPFSLAGFAWARVTFDAWLSLPTPMTDNDRLRYGYSTDGISYSVYSEYNSTIGWEQFTLSLADVCGETTVYVAIILETDNLTQSEGAYVDNVLIEAGGDDGYEENDVYTQAWDFTGGEDQWLSAYGGEMGVQSDDDYYEIVVAAGRERVVIDATFIDAEGDIDLSLMDASDVELAYSISTTDDEHIDYVVPGPGTYYLLLTYGNAGNQYDLRWQTISQLPDLVVTLVQPSKTNPAQSDTISIDVTVQNQGVSNVTGTFNVVLFHDRVPAPTVGTAGANATRTVSGLNMGDSIVLTFAGITYADVQAPIGTWYTYAIVDNANVIVENDDTVNNVRGPTSIVWSSSPPDLTVTSITAVPNPAEVGSTTTVTVRVDNVGGGDAGSFTLDLFENRASPPALGATGNQTTVGGVVAGDFATVDFIVSSSAWGTWSMYAIVDTYNTIVEEDDTAASNVFGPATLTWQGVDLEVTAITPSNASPLIGSSISYDVTVRNNGNIASGAFDIGLYKNEPSTPPAAGSGAEYTDSTVATLAAGASTTVTFSGISNTVREDWTTYAIADDDSPGLIAEYNETNNRRSTAVNWKAPQLAIDYVLANPSNPTTADTINVTVRISNAGDGTASNFRVDLFYDLAAQPAVTTAGDDFRTVASLAPGAWTVATFDNIPYADTVTPEFVWYLYASVDQAETVLETNETDNVSTQTQIIWSDLQPDLTIVSVTATPSTQSVGDSVDVTVTVRNDGSGDAGSFQVDLIQHSATTPSIGTPGDYQDTVDGLPAGTETPVVFPGLSSAVLGVWSMYAIVDTVQLVNEESETNNISSASTVTWQGIDLHVTAMTPQTANPVLGQTMYVDVTVENLGNLASGLFDLALFYDPSKVPEAGDAASQEIEDSLNAGFSKIIRFNGVTSATTGPWSMYAFIDNDNPGRVDEYNEFNNLFGPLQTVTWRAPDLVVTDVSPSSLNPSIPGTIDVVVTVQNQGDAPAGPFTVGLYHNEAAAPAAGSAGGVDGKTTQAVGGLASGGTVPVTFSGIFNDENETWHMYALADDGTVIAEGVENNNHAGPVDVAWGGLQPDLELVSVVPSSTSPIIGTTISVAVTIRNTSATVTASGFNLGLFYDASSPQVGIDTPDRTRAIATLGPTEELEVVFTGITNLVPDAWTTYAIVDVAGAVSETDETNNRVGPVGITWRGPDLMIAGMAVTVPAGQQDPDVGDTITVSVTVRNDSATTAVSAPFTVDLYADSGDATPIGTSVVNALASSTQVPVPFDISSSVFATWDLYAVVDLDDVLLEYDETNNNNSTAYPLQIVWHGPDLVVDTIAPELASPSTAMTIWVDVTVTNNGDRDAADCVVALFENLAVAPTMASTTTHTQNTALTLTQGNSTTVRFSGLNNVVEEDWQMWAIVDYVQDDPDGALIEGDETNNVSAPETISWGGVRLEVSAPASGETLYAGGMTDIRWESFGDLGSSFVAIEFSSANGAGGTWSTVASSTLNDGVFEWEVPSVDSSQCIVRVRTIDSIVIGDSAAFTVAATGPGAPDLEIIAFTVSDTRPAVGSDLTVEVTVRNVGDAVAPNVYVCLHWTNTPPIAGTNADAANGDKHWLGPDQNHTAVFTVSSAVVTVWDLYAVADTSDTIYQADDELTGPVHVSWGGVTTPDTISVTAPNGGEGFVEGEQTTITWDFTGNPVDASGFVYIEASIDGGLMWTEVEQDVAVWLQTYDWTIGVSASTDCRVRISNYAGTVSDVSDAPFTIVVPDTVTLTAPNVAATFEQDDVLAITWDHTGTHLPDGLVDIELSTNGGASYAIVVAQDVPIADGSYDWTVASAASTDCLIRVSSHTGTASDESDVAFTINPDTLVLVTPNGGQVFDQDEVVAVSWSHTGAHLPDGLVDIELSIDGGSTYSVVVAQDVAVDDGTYSWTVSAPESTNCLIRIQNNAATVSDESDAVFTINPAPDTITVTAPNGGQIFDQDEVVTITWDHTGAHLPDGLVDVQLSVNGGADWTDLAQDLAVSAGTYSWTVDAPASTDCLIKIVNNAVTASDQSDAVFTINPEPDGIVLTAPNGGERLVVGEETTVSWTYVGLASGVVMIELSTGNGTTWHTVAQDIAVADGAYVWTVEGNASVDCLVKVSSAAVSDVSDDVFEIVRPVPLYVGKGCAAAEGSGLIWPLLMVLLPLLLTRSSPRARRRTGT